MAHEVSEILFSLSKYPPSGVIVTARKFDRERQREYAVTVTATDQATDPLIGICQLNILILDQNDNSPKFENLRYECELAVTVLQLQLCSRDSRLSSSEFT